MRTAHYESAHANKNCPLNGAVFCYRIIIWHIYVYILKSLKDNCNYIGSTIDLQKRINQHKSGWVKSTKNRLPLILYGFRKFDSIQEAAIWEKKYKRSHGQLLRDIKKGLIVLLKSE